MEASHSPRTDMSEPNRAADLFSSNHDEGVTSQVDDLFGSDTGFVDSPQSKKIDFSQERAKIESEIELATNFLKNFRVDKILKEELVNFAVDYYDITPDNVSEVLENASTNLQEGLHDLLKDQGITFDRNNAIDPSNEVNSKALKNPETAATLEKYLETINLLAAIKNFKSHEFEIDDEGNLKLDTSEPTYEDAFDSLLKNQRPPAVEQKIVHSLEATSEDEDERIGALLFKALESYKFESDLEEELVGEILKKIKDKKLAITPDNINGVILSIADKLKTEITIALIHAGFSIDSTSNLTLTADNKKILENETIDWNLKLLEGIHKITDPNIDKSLKILPNEIVPKTGNSKETVLISDNDIKLAKELLELGFSDESIEASRDPLIVEAFSNTTINTPQTSQRGLAGLEQVISRAISTLEKQAGFTIGPNNEPILSENFLQKTILFWNKASRINNAKNSPEYKRLRTLLSLQSETKQKINELTNNQKSRETRKNLAPVLVDKNSTLKNLAQKPSLRKIAVASSLAGMLAGDALPPKNAQKESIDAEETSSPISKILSEPTHQELPATIEPRSEEEESTISQNNLSEITTVPELPAVNTQVSETETRQARRLTTENLVQPVDQTTTKSTFKKPVGFKRPQTPRPVKRVKIDPFTYHDTNPATAPKLERPSDDSDYEEAPDLDNPPAYHKRLVEKLPKPVERPKDKPYLETPAVAGTVKGPEEKVTANYQLNPDKKQQADKELVDKKTMEFYNQVYQDCFDIFTIGKQLANFDDEQEKEMENPNFNPVLWANAKKDLTQKFDTKWRFIAQNGPKAVTEANKLIEQLKAQLGTALKMEKHDLQNKIETLANVIALVGYVQKDGREKILRSSKEEAAIQTKKIEAAKAERKLEPYPVLKPVARKKESSYLATPSVAGTVKGPEEKINPNLSLKDKLEPYPVLKPVKRKPGSKTTPGSNLANSK